MFESNQMMKYLEGQFCELALAEGAQAMTCISGVKSYYWQLCPACQETCFSLFGLCMFTSISLATVDQKGPMGQCGMSL